MSTEIKRAKGTTMPLRKATFLVEDTAKGEVFRPVNKRAHKWAKKLFGRRTKLSRADLKDIAKTKRVKVYAYTATGVLRKAVA